MSRRTKALERLAARAGSLDGLAQALLDTRQGDALVPLQRPNLAAALAEARAGRWSLSELRRWAELVEWCDDLTLDDDASKEVLFVWANPDIHPPLTQTQLDAWLVALLD